MLDGLKPYPAYKESGVPWLGKVPEHWEVRRGKSLFTEAAIPVRDSDEIVTCFRDGQVTFRRNRRSSGFMVALKEVGYQGVRRGQLVIHAMDAFAGAVGVSDSDGKCTPEYIVCDPRASDTVAAYFSRALRVAAGSRFIEVACPAVRERAPRLRYPDFGAMLLPLPPHEEQVSIVRFLEHADRQIRLHVRGGQKIIKLLEQQKPAIVDLVVTRGSDSSARLGASGIDWLGDIPAHWRVARLRNLTSRITSGSRGWSGYAADSGPLFIRIGNLTRSSVDLDLEDVVRLDLPRETAAEAARTRVAHGDVLISITAFIGSVAVVPSFVEEAYVSQHVACARLAPGVANPRWVAYVLLSSVGQTHGVHSMYGGTKQGLSLDDVKNYPVLLPSLAEQDDLVRRIDALLAPIDSAIAAVKRQIKLATELRARLTADVVSGKLDVRDAAAELSDLGDELAGAGCDDLGTENGVPSEADLEDGFPGDEE